MWPYLTVYVRFLLILICHFLVINNITEANRVFLKIYLRTATQSLQNLNLKPNLYIPNFNKLTRVPEDENQTVHTIDPHRPAARPSLIHHLPTNLYNTKNDSTLVPEDENQTVHTIDPYKRALRPSFVHYLLTNLYNKNLNQSTQVPEDQNQTVHTIDPYKRELRPSFVHYLLTNLYNKNLNQSTQVPENQNQTVHTIDPNKRAARPSFAHYLPTNLHNTNLNKSTQVPEDQNQTIHTIDPRAARPNIVHYRHSPIQEREAHNETLTAFYREPSAVTKVLREGEPLTQHEANQYSSAFQFQTHQVVPVHIVMLKHKFRKGEQCN